MSEAKQKLAKGRLLAQRRTPYFTAALYALVPREVPDGTFKSVAPDGTMGVTENGFLLYEPQFILRCSNQQIAAALIHEVNHWVRNHAKMTRQMNWDPQIANLAQDAAINDDIERMRMELPHKFLPKDIPAPDGLSEKEYYDRLIANMEMIEQRVCCGSGAGNPLPGEPKDDPKARTPREVENVRQEVAEAVRRAPPGSVPNAMKRWAEEKLERAKVKWEDQLGRICRSAVAYKAGAVDYRYSRPSRRQAGIGYGPGKPILPSLIAPVPEVAVGIDTSGSMGKAELSKCAAETGAILRAVGASITLISCDCQIHEAGKLRDKSKIAGMLKGGGGTDFRPFFQHVWKLKPRPEILIIITDGCGPAPAKAPPGLKVIWVLVGPYKRRPAPDNDYGKFVSYGSFIEVD